MNLRDEFIQWLYAYIPEKGEREGIASAMAHKAFSYCKTAFGLGFFVGIAITILILKYFA